MDRDEQSPSYHTASSGATNTYPKCGLIVHGLTTDWKTTELTALSMQKPTCFKYMRESTALEAAELVLTKYICNTYNFNYNLIFFLFEHLMKYIYALGDIGSRKTYYSSVYSV